MVLNRKRASLWFAFLVEALRWVTETTRCDDDSCVHRHRSVTSTTSPCWNWPSKQLQFIVSTLTPQRFSRAPCCPSRQACCHVGFGYSSCFGWSGVEPNCGWRLGHGRSLSIARELDFCWCFRLFFSNPFWERHEKDYPFEKDYPKGWYFWKGLKSPIRNGNRLESDECLPSLGSCDFMINPLFFHPYPPKAACDCAQAVVVKIVSRMKLTSHGQESNRMERRPLIGSRACQITVCSCIVI